MLQTVPLRLLIILACALLLTAAHGAPAAPVAANVPAAAPAPGSANTVIPVRDANDKLIRTEPNPEASTLIGVPATPAKKAASTANLLGEIIAGILKLLAVLIVAYFAMMLMKRYYLGGQTTAPGAGAPRATRTVHVLETASLGQGRQLHLVAAGKRCFLLGATTQQVSLLGEVSDDAEVCELLARVPAQSDTGAPFQQVLSRLLPTAPDTSSTAGKEHRA